MIFTTQYSQIKGIDERVQEKICRSLVRQPFSGVVTNLVRWIPWLVIAISITGCDPCHYRGQKGQG